MFYWRTPEGVSRRFVDGRFGQIHYRIARPSRPQRVPLMCFHLSPSSGRIYARLLAAMARDRIAIAPDTPGFGESDAPPEPPEIADYAAAMGEVLDTLEIGAVDLLGYHTGSKIAVELAQQRPQQVRRLVLVSAPIYTPEELTNQKADYAARPHSDDGAHLKAAWDSQWKWRAKDTPIALVQREMTESLRGGDKSWWGHRAAFNYAHADNLPNVSQPVYVLCPKDDLFEATQRAADYIGNGRIVDMPGWAGHGMLDTHTGEVAEILRLLLDSPGGGSDGSAAASKPIPPAPTPAAKPFRRRFSKGPCGPLHFRIAEPGRAKHPPLMCLHSSPNSGRIYDQVLAQLGTDRVVVAPDTPGFGDSEAPPEPVEIEDYARTMSWLADELGFAQVDLMGYHTGSDTCIEIARQRPELVRRIVMNSAPIFTDAELAELKQWYEAAELSEDGSHLVERWKRMIPFYGPTVPREVMARNFAEGLRGGPASHWGHRAAFNYPLQEKMPEVEHPILVINLDDDLTEHTKRAAPLLRNGRIHTIEGYGHAWFDVIPEEAGRILREFLDPPGS